MALMCPPFFPPKDLMFPLHCPTKQTKRKKEGQKGTVTSQERKKISLFFFWLLDLYVKSVILLYHAIFATTVSHAVLHNELMNPLSIPKETYCLAGSGPDCANFVWLWKLWKSIKHLSEPSTPIRTHTMCWLQTWKNGVWHPQNKPWSQGPALTPFRKWPINGDLFLSLYLTAVALLTT